MSVLSNRIAAFVPSDLATNVQGGLHSVCPAARHARTADTKTKITKT